MGAYSYCKKLYLRSQIKKYIIYERKSTLRRFALVLL